MFYDKKDLVLKKINQKKKNKKINTDAKIFETKKKDCKGVCGCKKFNKMKNPLFKKEFKKDGVDYNNLFDLHR
tara:strand:- start:10 stop:228 length:219 start_codon:yes stop_codon:yes gene_type:complete